MHSHILMTIITLSFAGFHGIYSQQISRTRRPVCNRSTRPCRLRRTFLNGTGGNERINHLCVCSSPNSCSDDWSLSSHVISVKVISTAEDITRNMMFCQAVQPSRECNNGEEALVMSGPISPSNVVSFNCRCSDSAPLLPGKRTSGEDFLYNYSYVCNNYMPTCPSSTSYCSTRLSNGVSYNCKCPNGSYCQDPETDAGLGGRGLCQE